MPYLDTRDLIKRREELADLSDDNPNNLDIECEELAALTDLLDTIGPEAEHGVTLIPDYLFNEYAQELAEDCGLIPKDLAWPCTHIDWEAAIDELRMDYTSVDYDGTTYYYRS